MARRVAIYARVSRADRDDPTSIPVQVADCRRRAKEEGWEIAEIYEETGISAWNPKRRRPAFEQLLNDIEIGRVDTILVREQERLLRQMGDAVRVQKLATDGRLRLIAATMESDINFARARDRDDFRKRATQAEFYSDFLSEKVRATKARQREIGQYTGGEREPFGYRRVGRSLTVDLEESAALHDAVTRLAGGETATGICREWNRIGLRTSKGARWRPETLRRLLLSEHLVGGRGYPRVLSDEESAVARAAVAREERRVGRPVGLKAPLAGYLRCAECGSKLSTGSGAYRCTPSHGGCGAVSIKAIPLERHVLVESFRRWIEVYGDRQDGERRREDEPSPDTEPLLDELRTLEEREGQIADGLADGTLTVAVAGKAMRQVETRRREVTEQLARHLPPPQSKPLVRRPDEVFRPDELRSLGLRVTMFAKHGGAEQFATLWEDRDPEAVEQVRALYGEVLDHAVISRRERRGRAFDPTRVRLAWKVAR